MPRTDNIKSREALLRALSFKNTAIHMIGIGGVSMSALAELLFASGYKISGSDREQSPTLERLCAMGIDAYSGHRTDTVGRASLVVYSHAISPKDTELRYARGVGIPTFTRSELLGAVMLDYGDRIGISGTHGKSTVTAMLDQIFTTAGSDHTTLCGAPITPSGSLRLGVSKDTLIYEACEYKDSFLDFSPTVAVGLNLEYDHTDYFPDIQELEGSFVKSLSGAERLALINSDDAGMDRIKGRITSPLVTFSRGERSDYTYTVHGFCEKGYIFAVSKGSLELARVELPMIGVHNVINATAALVTAAEFGIDPAVSARALGEYRGIKCRLEYVGRRGVRAVYRDYAHHPSEIAAGINALRMSTHEKVTVVFKPHTYSRTSALWEDFVRALSLADSAVLTDIYPAREDPIPGITSRRLAEAVGRSAVFSSDYDVERVVDTMTDGVIVIMGAGGLDNVADSIIAHRS